VVRRSMEKIDRVYWRTEAGARALTSGVVGIAEGEHRRILRLINGKTHFDVVRAFLLEYADADIYQWLSELERRGLIASIGATAEHNLDFTDSFNMATLLAAKRAQSQ
jgi:hypothetical protein